MEIRRFHYCLQTCTGTGIQLRHNGFSKLSNGAATVNIHNIIKIQRVARPVELDNKVICHLDKQGQGMRLLRRSVRGVFKMDHHVVVQETVSSQSPQLSSRVVGLSYWLFALFSLERCAAVFSVGGRGTIAAAEDPQQPQPLPWERSSASCLGSFTDPFVYRVLQLSNGTGSCYPEQARWLKPPTRCCAVRGLYRGITHIPDHAQVDSIFNVLPPGLIEAPSQLHIQLVVVVNLQTR